MSAIMTSAALNYDLGWDQPHLDGHRVELAVASLQD